MSELFKIILLSKPEDADDMWRGWKFFTDKSGETIRCVKSVGEGFMVIKMFKESGVFTFKYWQGSFDETFKHWSTRERVKPTKGMVYRLQLCVQSLIQQNDAIGLSLIKTIFDL